MNAEKKFNDICSGLSRRKDVQVGKMMSSPALKYKNKVFAFFYKESMGFKLETEEVLQENGISNYALLSPFKTKPPLKGWYIVDESYIELWEVLAEDALFKMEKLLS